MTRTSFTLCNKKSGDDVIATACAENSCEWTNVLKPYMDENGAATAEDTRTFIIDNQKWLGKYLSSTER